MKKPETIEQLNEWINQEKVVLYFTAGWCPDCVVIEPVLPEIEEKFQAYTFIKVDRDEFIDICQQYDVFGIPSFIVLAEGKELGRFVSKNRKSQEEIETFLSDLPG
ncbi:thioredoxin family protein [Virgibacillus halodenitrificans]|uniref:thioredoxin family protein n=1 Tax=Virgibacillus halodenitrificans TaxID=1482 RepID=UPI0002DF90D8|nr:thioredoxin family protein [Virgibacillus halodenitrificans]MYL44753.1 thiol reductase thioredoxin [Virgibacillus halodenitrificans]WHX27789.1 thioredoxin family protein [Virgibacillus halodenitrificans]